MHIKGQFFAPFLFPDTELRENRSKYIGINIDLTGDITQVTHGSSDIHSHKICGYARFKPLECFVKVDARFY